MVAELHEVDELRAQLYEAEMKVQRLEQQVSRIAVVAEKANTILQAFDANPALAKSPIIKKSDLRKQVGVSYQNMDRFFEKLDPHGFLLSNRKNGHLYFKVEDVIRVIDDLKPTPKRRQKA